MQGEAVIRHLAAVWLLAVSTATHAFMDFELVLAEQGYYTGQELYTLGKGTSLFTAYVTAVYDADRTSQRLGPEYCVPRGVRAGQLADVAYQYLDNNPATRHLSAAYLARMSFRAAFPCPPAPR
ncbi:Rap1a/Tai family immunity protein [Hydrogenophaga sp.]|uniref:Rap1a/Tai family immunity protein n=1 Tax=Hydrogenophaga sp. TaxID=1904254 RepID=UPI00351CC5AC